MILLDPLQIIDNLSVHTPLFVINYVATFYKVPYKEYYMVNDDYYLNIIKNIIDTDKITIASIDRDISERDIQKLVKFCSPFLKESEWYIDNILASYENLMSYSDKDLPEIKSLTFGCKTNDIPDNINELMSYKIAKHLNYHMDRHTTFDEVIFFIRNIYTQKSVRNSLLHTINSLDTPDLLKLYYMTTTILPVEEKDEKNEEKKEEFKFINMEDSVSLNEDLLAVTLTDFFEVKSLITKIKITNKYDAIIVAAIKYHKNIIESSCPIKEIHKLSLGRYIPVCENFAKKYAINRSFYHVNKRWVENLSSTNIYTSEQLYNFVIEEGFQNVKHLSFLELNAYLKSTKISFNVYFGKHPYCKQTQSVYLNDIRDIPNDELLCMGIEKTHDLHYITINEFNKYLEVTKMYMDPFFKLRMDRRVINKIKVHYMNSTHYDVKKLMNTFESLDHIEKLLDSSVFNFKTQIDNFNEDIRVLIKNFFINTMEMGLYMRGWKIYNEEYPLKSQNTVYNMDCSTVPSEDIKIFYDDAGLNIKKYSNQQKVIDNTLNSYGKAVQILEKLPSEISHNIKKLHTLRFNTKFKSVEILGQFYKGVRVYHEENIIDCMTSIFKGLGNDDSCLRTASNWILFTSMWYLLIFGFEKHFDMEMVDDIS